MPIESVQQFLEQVSSDQSLQKELKQVLEKENKREAITELAEVKGYNFSPDELWEEVQKRQNEFEAKKAAGELSDEELEAVAGGAEAHHIGLGVAITSPAGFLVPVAVDKAEDAW